MDRTFQETFEARAARLSRVESAFARVADDLLKSWRAKLWVPDDAEPEVEQEWLALRAMFDERFLPAFCKLYADLVRQHVGADDAAILSALEQPAVQAYLSVIERVETDLNTLLRQQLPAVRAVLTAATP